MARVAVIGASGQLGSDCVRAFGEAGHEVIELNHDRVDLVDAASLERAFAETSPAVVVNTAAFHNVPACEEEPARAFEVNGIGSRNLALAAEKAGIRLLHVSTDYVFDGAKGKPYTEDDLPRPLNVYGNTKLSGEHFVLAVGGDAAVVRTSGLYGRMPCRAKGGRNFAQTMLKLARERGEVKVVSDEYVTPTYTLDLARQLVTLAEADLTGIVHATCQGECSWYDFARAIFDLAGVEVRLEEASAAEFPGPVERPSYSVLANTRLAAAGIDRLPHWRESLESYLGEIGELPVEAVVRGAG